MLVERPPALADELIDFLNTLFLGFIAFYDKVSFVIKHEGAFDRFLRRSRRCIPPFHYEENPYFVSSTLISFFADQGFFSPPGGCTAYEEDDMTEEDGG